MRGDLVFFASCDTRVGGAVECDLPRPGGRGGGRGEEVIEPFGGCGGVDAEKVGWVGIGGGEKASFGRVGEVM